MSDDKARLLAELEMRRDAVMHAIRNRRGHRIPDSLWEMGRDLTRKIRALTNPGVPVIDLKEFEP